MRIETEVKLDFDDVLIRPKRSTLSSREKVELNRTFRTKWQNTIITGVPIIAANMDTIGTFAMAKSLANEHMFTSLHKHYPLNELLDFYKSNSEIASYVFYTLGTVKTDFDKFLELNTILYNSLGYTPIHNICLDVANGYTEYFVDSIKRLREKFPKITLMAGNVVTAEMTEELIMSGADIVKVGIGPGCFAPGQKVKTETGLKNIEDIDKGEKVLTHTGVYKTVTNTFRFDDKKSIVNVNGIKATPNHEFYVLYKKYKEIVTDDNIHQYAEWIKAKDLTKDYLLQKLRVYNNTVLKETNMRFELIEIDVLETESYDGYTYDLEVEEDHSYNIEGVVVHNSVCTTRLKTGVGYPQLSATIECADAAHGLGGLICTDGGLKVAGDFGKAFGAGADFVMCGGIFAGHDECGGEIVNGKMKFYGMSSDTAMNMYSGGVAAYRASEGKTVEVPYRGPINNTILEILGGLRSTCTYIGALKLKELSKRTTFVMVNRQLNNKFDQNVVISQ